MIWFFLAGMIAGAVGAVKFSRWWVTRHFIPVSPEEVLEDLKRAGYTVGDGTGDPEGREVPEPGREGNRNGDMGSSP